MIAREHQLYQQIAEFMRYQYPDAIYRFDLAADLKLTMGQAAKHKALHPKRGYPDLFIAEPRLFEGKLYAGLFLELKADGNTPFKKDGGLKAGQHLQEQQEMLEQLRGRGYKAEFSIGFESTIDTIKRYLDERR